MFKKRIGVISLFVICILFMNIIKVSADKTIDIQPSVINTPDDNNILYHSSGKMVYAHLDTSTEKGYAEIFSALGSYEAQIEQASGLTSARSISLIEWDSNHFIMVINGYDGGNHKISFVKCNINTYSASKIESATGLQVYHGEESQFVIKANNFIWVFDTFGQGGSTPYPRYVTIHKYNGTSETASHYNHNMESGTTVPFATIHGFQGTGLYSDKLFLIIPKEADNQKPVYYMYDMDSNTLTELATHSLSGRYHDDGYQRFQHYLYGDIITSGNLKYVVHSWVYSYVSGTTRLIKLIQHRLIFNQTIAVANLTAQSEIVLGISPNLASDTPPCWSHGYMEDKETCVLYYANTGEGEIVASKQELTISNWFDYSGNAQWVIGDYIHDSGEINFHDHEDVIRRDFSAPFQANENSGYAYIYTGLFVPVADYAVGLTYTPQDDPLITDKNYRFTVTTTMNGIGTSTSIEVYFDDGLIVTGKTDGSGQKQFTLFTSIAGYHNMTVNAYAGTPREKIASTSKEYQWSVEGEELPTTTTLLPVTIRYTTQLIPILLIVLTPTIALQKAMEHLIGALIGLNIGIFICITSGVLPSSLLYIVLLMDIIGMIYVVKSGG